MAEVVELKSEYMIPEFEQLEKMKLFDQNEKRNIMKKREKFEYKLQRTIKRKRDTLRYIQYEMDLLKIIRQRKIEKGITQKKDAIEFKIANHINALFNFAIRRFSSDAKIWLSYIKFCTQVRIYSCASRVLDQMLKLHGDKPLMFKLAAQWEFEECHCISKARKFLQDGIHIHKNSKLLYKEAFLLELNFASTKRKEILDKGKTIDCNDNVLNGKAAEVVYDSAVKQISDVDFVVDLLAAAREYNFTETLQKKIVDDLVLRFPLEELTWDAMARRALEGKDSSGAKLPLKERIKGCTMIYNKAVRSLNTERMWAMYLDRMLELCKDTSSLPNFKNNCLSQTFNNAHNQGMISEKYYLIWMEHLKSLDKHEDMYKVLKKGTNKLPGSVTLWAARLKHHLTRGEEGDADSLFREALAGLGDSSLPIWKLMLQYYQTSNSMKTEKLFKEGIVLTPGISDHLKPLYLEWLTLSRGIVAARKAYKWMANVVPFCLEMHTKMAEMEDIQFTLSLKNVRKCHELTCLQFGSTNTDVWMEYVKFEQMHGNPKNVVEIYNKALKNLQPNLVDTFESEFSLSKPETFTIPQCLAKLERPDEPMDTT